MREAGCVKIDFAGGEPFLQPRFLGILVQYAKSTLLYESVSIISNASKLDVMSKWFDEFGIYVDILGVSCDSSNEETNFIIGRHAKGRDASRHVLNIIGASQVCVCVCVSMV